MNTIKYLVTNNSEGSICVAGRQRLEIPGKCVDLEISLPDTTAKATVTRLKQRYPLLSFRKVEDAAPAAEALAPEAEPPTPEVDTPAPAKNAKKKPAHGPATTPEATEPASDTSEAGNGN